MLRRRQSFSRSGRTPNTAYPLVELPACAVHRHPFMPCTRVRRLPRPHRAAKSQRRISSIHVPASSGTPPLSSISNLSQESRNQSSRWRRRRGLCALRLAASRSRGNSHCAEEGGEALWTIATMPREVVHPLARIGALIDA